MLTIPRHLRSLTRSIVVAAAVAVPLAGALAQAEMTPDEIKAAIERDYDVQVLKIEKVQGPEGDVYAVTVMNPGGNRNDAFLVTTIAVDPATGALVRQPLETGSTAAGADRDINEESGTILRRSPSGVR